MKKYKLIQKSATPPRGPSYQFQGEPYYYECLFDESKGYREIYQLYPIDDETFKLALEDWDIWKRWQSAFHDGNTTIATHPALPEDRGRDEELKIILDEKLKINVNKTIRQQVFLGLSPYQNEFLA